MYRGLTPEGSQGPAYLQPGVDVPAKVEGKEEGGCELNTDSRRHLTRSSHVRTPQPDNPTMLVNEVATSRPQARELLVDQS